MSQDQVILAAIAGAHGVRGEVRLKLFAASIETLGRHKAVQVGDRDLILDSVKASGATPVARFVGISDRNAAEALRGSVISVPRSALPPLDEGEFYYADLIGLPCEDSNGAGIGTVVAVENFGAGDLVEIERPDGRRTLVPFRDGVADLADGRIVVDPLFLT